MLRRNSLRPATCGDVLRVVLDRICYTSTIHMTDTLITLIIQYIYKSNTARHECLVFILISEFIYVVFILLILHNVIHCYCVDTLVCLNDGRSFSLVGIAINLQWESYLSASFVTLCTGVVLFRTVQCAHCKTGRYTEAWLQIGLGVFHWQRFIFVHLLGNDCKGPWSKMQIFVSRSLRNEIFVTLQQS
jgi:hypothetical protein